MLFSALRGRRLLAPGSPSVLGRVVDLVIDPLAMRIEALCVDDRAAGRVVIWPAIAGFVPDAVMLRSKWSVGPAEGRVAELIATGHHALDMPVLTETGTRIGRLNDVEFDPETGTVTRLITSRDAIQGRVPATTDRPAAAVGQR
jgi:sporulation protein YlmC with PRC-barrel domain